VYRIQVTGTIEMGLAPYIQRSLKEAAAEGAEAAILDLDTPGGRVDSAWEIIDAVRDAELPVYAYVNRRALSAGAMIALSADGLYMRPGSTIGAATPVMGEGEKASEKMVSAMRSEFRALAEERGFDPRIAEAMVDEEIEVEGVVSAGKLLTLTTDEALELGVATGEVEDYEALLTAVGLSGAAAVEPVPNWAERIVRFLTNPMVAPRLLSLGFLGLLIEIRTPSFGLAGGVGLLCLAAFFGARLLVNLAGIEELLLLGGGIVLLLVEAFVIPGFGVAGAVGILSVLGAAYMSMLGRFPTTADLVNTAGIIGLSIVIVAVLAFALLRHLPHSRTLSGIFLKSETSRDTGYISAPVREELVGKIGVAVTDLRPSGTAIIDDERIDVVTEGPWIEEGAKVIVRQAESYRHVVREVHEGEDTPTTE
jgi:membrane-bound serine protease (ClpP class)